MKSSSSGPWFTVQTVVLLILLGMNSCTTYHKGDYVGDEEIKGTRRIDSWAYSVKLDSIPTVDRPIACFHIEKIPLYQFQTASKYMTMARPSYGLAALAGVLAAGAGVLLQSENKRFGGPMAVVGLSTAAVSGLLYKKAKSRPTGRFNFSKPRSAHQRGQAELDSDGVLFAYKRDLRRRDNATVHPFQFKNGRLRLHMLDSLKFKYEEPISIAFDVSQAMPLEGDVVTLHSALWTVPFFRITEKNGSIMKSNRPGGTKSGVFESSNEFAIADTSTIRKDMVQISYKDGTGYIPVTAGRIVWYPRFDPTRVPNVVIDTVVFDEPSGNGYLDADEVGIISLRVSNAGEGVAQGIVAMIRCDGGDGLSFQPTVSIGYVSKHNPETISIPVKASKRVASKEVLFTVDFEESNGHAPPSIKFTVSTLQFTPPSLVTVLGSRDRNLDGAVQPGEDVIIMGRIHNNGKGIAKDVKVSIETGANVFFRAGTETRFRVGELKPGDSRQFEFTVYATKKANKISVVVTTEESQGLYGDRNRQFAIDLDKAIVEIPEDTPVPMPEPDVWNIEGSGYVNSNAIAVVIGNKSYNKREGVPGGKIPDAEFALRDARLIEKYLQRVFGYDSDNVFFVPDATGGTLRDIFGDEKSHKGKLELRVKPNVSDVFVYYSGHGVPAIDDSAKAYLVPSDGSLENISATGYSIEQLYENLSKLEARSVTVVIDACFSGAYSDGTLFGNSSMTKIRVRNSLVFLKPNTVVFTSSTGDQVSSWDRRTGHSVFTYFFAKGLQKKIYKVSDLETFVIDNVREEAAKLGREQTATCNSLNKDKLIVRMFE